MKKLLQKITPKLPSANKNPSKNLLGKNLSELDESTSNSGFHNKFLVKIIIILIVISFAFFGISEIFIGSSNSWVAKVGGDKISAELFYKTIETDRKIIRTIQPNNERVEAYLNSENFRSDVLSRMIRKAIVTKVSKDFGLSASEKLILSSVAKDQTFHDENGKFNRQKFRDFLAKNGLDESRYIREVSDEVVAELIMQSFAISAPVNFKAALELENFNQEQRIADVIQISTADIKFQSPLSDADLEKFYNENKAEYASPETRKIVYFETDANALATQKPVVLEEEIKQEFEKNRENLILPETRNFLHVSFAEKNKAQEFIDKLNAGAVGDAKKFSAEFLNLATKLAKKTSKEISFEKVSKAQLPEAIAGEVFKLPENQLSQIVESPIGFHVFLVSKITEQKPVEFAEVKERIRDDLLAKKQENAAQQKLSEINDQLIASDNIEMVAKKFGFKTEAAIEIEASGKSTDGEKVTKIAGLKDFLKTAFELKSKQISKIINADKKLYALQVVEVKPARQREFSEVKQLVIKDSELKAKQEAASQLAKSVYDQLVKNPSAFSEIATSNHLKVEKNRNFPRNFVVNLGGDLMPYKNQFLQELFSKKIGELTSPGQIGQGTYAIALIKGVKKAQLNEEQQASLRKNSAKSFAEDIMLEYNQYLQSRFPVEVNDKFFKNNSKEKDLQNQ